MFEYSVAMLLNNKSKKRKEEKENFRNRRSNNNSGQSNSALIISLIQILILIYALYLFFQCKKLKNEFKLLEFLAALCYPLFYIIYRLFVPVNQDNCKSTASRIAEELRKIR